MFSAWETYEKQLRIEKTRLSHQAWSHGGSTLKKRTLNGHFSRPAETEPYVHVQCIWWKCSCQQWGNPILYSTNTFISAHNWNSGIPAVVSTSRRGQTPIPNSVAMEHRDAINNDNNINNMEVHNIYIEITKTKVLPSSDNFTV